MESLFSEESPSSQLQNAAKIGARTFIGHVPVINVIQFGGVSRDPQPQRSIHLQLYTTQISGVFSSLLRSITDTGRCNSTDFRWELNAVDRLSIQNIVLLRGPPRCISKVTWIMGVHGV